MSWSPSPNSRHRSAAQGFSVRKESGPASTTQPSICSVRITPPKCWLDSYSTNSSSPPADLFCSAKAAESPAAPPPMTAILFLLFASAGAMLAGNRDGVSRLDNFRQGGNQQRGIVYRFSACKQHALRRRELLEP